MTHEEYLKRRDEVIESIYTVVGPYSEVVRRRTAQAIDALVLEVIGEDINAIERNTYAQITKYDEIGDHQNGLRAEQRRIVKGEQS